MPSDDDSARVLESASCPRTGVDVELIEAERRARLRHLITLVPERLAEAIWLRYFEELSEKEMATRLGIPVGTVKSRIHHGIQRLKPRARDER